MPSPLDICNMALAHLGERSDINSIDPPEASVEAQLCARFYPMARQSAIEMKQWSFATKRVKANDVSPLNPPPSGYMYVYAYPSDALKVIALRGPHDYRNEAVARDTSFEIGEQSGGTRVIYCNIENAEIQYVFDQIDATRFSGLFVEGLSWYLASKLAGPIIKSAEGMRVSQAAYQTAMALIEKAAADDANQSVSQIIMDDARNPPDWIKARGYPFYHPWGR